MLYHDKILTMYYIRALVSGISQSLSVPVLVGGRPVRQRLGYGFLWPPRIGRENSTPSSGFPMSL